MIQYRGAFGLCLGDCFSSWVLLTAGHSPTPQQFSRFQRLITVIRHKRCKVSYTVGKVRLPAFQLLTLEARTVFPRQPSARPQNACGRRLVSDTGGSPGLPPGPLFRGAYI